MSQNDEAGFRRDADALGAEDVKRATQPDEQVNVIRESIEQTRAEMSETIDELQERLSPSYLKEQVKEQVAEQFRHAKQMVREATLGKVENMVERVSDTVYDTRRSVGETIKSNPIPTALVGIGLAWLWMNRRSDSSRSDGRRSSGYRDTWGYDDMSSDYGRGGGSIGGRGSVDTSRDYTRGGTSMSGQSSLGNVADRATSAVSDLASKAAGAVGGVTSQVQDTARNLAGKARETASGVVDQAQTAASNLADQAQYQARRVEERFNGAMRESPLALGAVAIALGTAVGLAVPQTRKENEWMGEARDTLVDKAQSMAHETLQQVEQVAQRVTNEVSQGRDDRSQSQQGKPM